MVQKIDIFKKSGKDGWLLVVGQSWWAGLGQNARAFFDFWSQSSPGSGFIATLTKINRLLKMTD